MKKWIFTVVAVLHLCLGAVSTFGGKSNAYKPVAITEFGAVGDGETINTKSIQATIDSCAEKGGGVVVIPRGTFLTGAIFLKQNVHFRIEKEGVLKGTVKPEDYPQIQTRWEGVERSWISALVNIFDMTDVELTGEGTIDGSGDQWKKIPFERSEQGSLNILPGSQGSASSAGSAVKQGFQGRPRLIAVQNCQKVCISGLSLKNQACWGLFILYSGDVLVENLVIRAEHDIPMSDGIDVDSSRKVRIQACDIDVNDDCIAIKSGKDEDGRRVNRPAEDIVVEKCRFRYGHGGVSMGSEMSGGIRNVEIRDCVMDSDNWAPIRFKSQPSRGGIVENITYRDLKLQDTRKAFEFNLEWRMVPPLKPPSDPPPVVRNVKIINVSGTVDAVGNMHGLKNSPIRNVSFKKCRIKAKHGFVLDNTFGVDLSGLKLEVAEGEAIIRRSVP